MSKRYYRIAIIAAQDKGLASFSWRAKEALEALGHTVFYFSERTFSEVCTDGIAHLSYLNRFIEIQDIDCLMLADGVQLDDTASLYYCMEHTAVGLLCAQPDEVLRSVSLSCDTRGIQDIHYDFALCGCADLQSLDTLNKICDHVEIFNPVASRVYIKTPLANDIAFSRGILCVQDATPERIALIRETLDCSQLDDLQVYCMGNGWPQEWSYTGTYADFIYITRSSVAVVLFNEELQDFDDSDESANTDGSVSDHDYVDDDLSSWGSGWASDAMLALPLADKVSIVCVNGKPLNSCRHDEMVVVSGADGLRTELINLCELPRDLCDVQRNSAQTENQDTNQDTKIDDNLSESSSDTNYLEDELENALECLHDELATSNRMAGVEASRVIICVLGYFGMGNFGDEYILSTINARIRKELSGSTVIAISENPLHTLEQRGIFALTLHDKVALDAAFSYASAALVVAGLLFDQGMRWTCGKAEFASSVRHSTIPGIALYASLASMNDVPVVFYGIGAGPLDLSESRRMMKFIGDTGAIFMPRDEDTGRLLRACGISPSQVRVKADTAFLGLSSKTQRVDEWFENENISAGQGRLVAVSLRDYENLPTDFAERVAQAFDAVIEAQGYIQFALCLLDPNDRNLTEEVIKHMKYTGAAHIFDVSDDIDAVVDLLSRSDAGMSMRYHCSLLLNRFGKPCVGLDYLPKVASLYTEMGCADLLLPISATSDDMCARICNIFDTYESWCAVVKRGVEQLAARSDEALNELLAIIDQAPADAGDAANTKAAIEAGETPALPRAYYMKDRVESDYELEGVRAWGLDQVRISEEESARNNELVNERDDLLQQRDELAQRGDDLTSDLDRIKNSRSFKVGFALMRIPGACKSAVKRNRGKP